MGSWLILAQTSETVNQGIGWAERLIQGGPALIFAFFCGILGAVVYYQNKKIRDLEMQYRSTLEGQITTATENTEKLITAITKNASVMESNERALRDNHETMTRMNARLDQLDRQGA